MILSVLALLLAQAPQREGWHARYGPLTQCVSHYALAAGAGEAVIVGDGTLILATERLSLRFEVDSNGYYAEVPAVAELDVPGLGRVHRVVLQRLANPEPWLQSLYTYLLPPENGSPGWMIDSAAFDGSAHDLALLARLRRVENRAGCGDFHAPAWPGDDPGAATWRTSSRSGPFYQCQNGIGFAVAAGERTRRPWPHLGLEPALQVQVGPALLGVRGPEMTSAGAGRVASAFREAVENWGGGYVGGGLALGLGPPPLTGRSPTPAERVDADRAYWRTIRITYRQGQEAAARAFAQRLSFVGSGDPRCRGNPAAAVPAQ